MVVPMEEDGVEETYSSQVEAEEEVQVKEWDIIQEGAIDSLTPKIVMSVGCVSIWLVTVPNKQLLLQAAVPSM